MSDNEPEFELEEGDFVYQSDQELFLVVIGETGNSYQFAAHGWREIDKNRLEEYLDHQNGRLHRGSDIEKLVDDEADEDTVQNFEQLKDLFGAYQDADISEQGPHTDFALEDT